MELFSGKEMWWGLITGPREVIGAMQGCLQDGRSVVLLTKGELPWRSEFWRRVESGLAVKFDTAGMKLKDVDADSMGEGDEPVDCLLRSFALEDDAIDYRVGMDPYDYLISRRVLSGMIVRVHGKEKTKLRQWAGFCAKWPKGSRDTGLFVLEMPEECCGFDIGNLNRISYTERVTGYSIQLFCGLCLEHGVSSELSEARRRYLTSAMTHLCCDDVELSERLAERLNRPPFDPIAAYKYVDGELEDAEILKRLWEAQIETVFAIVQRRHMEIVDMLRPQIQATLDKYTVTRSNGERITDPDDTDPGTLVYLYTASDFEGNHLLRISDEKLRDEIYLLKDCRNALAHRRCCNEEEIKRLLD